MRLPIRRRLHAVLEKRDTLDVNSVLSSSSSSGITLVEGIADSYYSRFWWIDVGIPGPGIVTDAHREMCDPYYRIHGQKNHTQNCVGHIAETRKGFKTGFQPSCVFTTRQRTKIVPLYRFNVIFFKKKPPVLIPRLKERTKGTKFDCDRVSLSRQSQTAVKLKNFIFTRHDDDLLNVWMSVT